MAFDFPLSPKPWHVVRPPSTLDTRRTTGQAPTVYPSADSLANDIDMREEITGIMSRRGHYVYLRRTKERRCGCWSDTMRESKADCPHCTGTGWLYSDHLHLARRMPVTDPTVAALLEGRKAIGIMGVAQYLFWFGPDVDPTPSKRDLILEVTLDENTGLPVQAVKVEKIWNIGQVHPFRDKRGRIEYCGCWVREGALGKE